MMELRVSSVSLCFCLSFRPHLSLTVFVCVCVCVCVCANSQAWGYPTECILWVVFKGCCWVTAALPLRLGELWIATNQWHTVSQLPDWLQCHIAPSGLTQAHNKDCMADWTKVSLSLLLIISSACFRFLMLHSLPSLFKSKYPNQHVNTHYCANSN